MTAQYFPNVAYTDMGTHLNPYADKAGYGIACLGDSITAAYGNGDVRRTHEGYLSHACWANAQMPPMRGNFGGSGAGYTLSQISTILLPFLLAVSPRPAFCVIHGGTNDAGANSGVGFSVSSCIATISSMATQLRAIGIMPMLSSCIPRGDNATVNQNIGKLNRAIWKLAIENGYHFIDFHRAVCNVSTGGFIAGYSQTDLIHPSYLGVKKMSLPLTAALAAMPASYVMPTRATHRQDPTNLLTPDGHFQVDTNADGIGDGWTSFSGTGMTFSITTDADTITKWQKISVPNTGTGNALLQKSVASVANVGDTMEVTCRVQTTGFESTLVAPAAPGSGGTGAVWGVTLTAAGATQDIEAAYAIHTDQADGTVYARGIWSAGAASTIKVNLFINGQPATGTVTAQFTEVCVRNLTTLGLV